MMTLAQAGFKPAQRMQWGHIPLPGALTIWPPDRTSLDRSLE